MNVFCLTTIQTDINLIAYYIGLKQCCVVLYYVML